MDNRLDKIALTNILQIGILVDTENIKGMYLVKTGNGPTLAFALLYPTELKVMNLPDLGSWCDQVLGTQLLQSATVNSNNGNKEPIAPVLVWPLELAGSDDSIVRFAVIAASSQQSYQIAERETQKPPETPLGELGYSPELPTSHRRQPPPQWTSTETRTAILRARSALAAITNSVCIDDNPSRQVTSPLKSLDESAIFGSPIPKVREGENASPEFLAGGSTLATPATAVLDMSGRWMGRCMTDSVTSPLAGLCFLGDINTPLRNTASARNLVPPSSSRRVERSPPVRHGGADQSFQTEPQSCMMIVTFDLTQHRSTVMKYWMPPHLSSFQAIAVKACSRSHLEGNRPESELVAPLPPVSSPTSPGSFYEATDDFYISLLVHPQATTELYLEELHVTEPSIIPTRLKEVYDMKGLLNCNPFGLNSIAFVPTSAMDQERGHCVSAFAALPMKSSNHALYGPCESKLQATKASSTSFFLGTASAAGREPANASAPCANQSGTLESVDRKLDAMLLAFRQFESNVNSRLSDMENVLVQNSMMIARLEKLVTER